MTEKPLILIKLGGSVVTEKSQAQKPRLEVLKQLAKVILRALEKSESQIIIGHGQGSFGHIPAKKYGLLAGIQTPTDLEKIDAERMLQGMKETRQAVRELHQIVMKELLDAGVPAVSLIMSELVTTNNYLPQTSNLNSLLEMLNRGRVPVTTGDVLSDQATHSMVWSTEQIFSHLIEFLIKQSEYKITKQIMVTDVDGALDANGQLIEKITPQSFEDDKKHIGSSTNADVTGGMQHKVESALELAVETGIETHILSGLKPEELENNLTGRKWKGTVIAAS